MLLVYLPGLDPYLDYVPVQTESEDNSEYEKLPGDREDICPERHVNILSSMFNSSSVCYILSMGSLSLNHNNECS